MIVDQIGNRRRYIETEAMRVAFGFIESLDTDAEERRYPLQGGDIYAVVEGYCTKPLDQAYPEAHRKYVDIQTVLTGSERIHWWPATDLTIRDPYDDQRDIAFYQRPEQAGATVGLSPGRFVIFFPEDAHMPGLRSGTAPERVKKVVVKIALACLIPGK